MEEEETRGQMPTSITAPIPMPMFLDVPGHAVAAASAASAAAATEGGEEGRGQRETLSAQRRPWHMRRGTMTVLCGRHQIRSCY